MRKLLGLFVCVVAVSGCSTTPVPADRALPVSPDRVLAFQEKIPRATATIIVTRDEGILGSGCYLALFIDKQLSGRFASGEKATFFLEPGERLLRVGQDAQGSGLCAIPAEFGATRETTLRENETKYFRLLMEQNGTVDIQRSDR